jgi:hypothetical protein
MSGHLAKNRPRIWSTGPGIGPIKPEIKPVPERPLLEARNAFDFGPASALQDIFRTSQSIFLGLEPAV